MTSKGRSGSVTLSEGGEMIIRGLDIVAGRRPLVKSYCGVLPRGAFVWLRGSNGSGKSTFLAAMEARLRGGAAVVGWVHPGMGLPPGYRVGTWRRCLSKGGSGSLPFLAGRLEATLPFRKLSTGEQRLILMEGVLALPRDVLLMDEVLEHLSPDRRHEVVEAIRSHGAAGVTWLASHVPPMRAEKLPAASHIVTLDGRGGHSVHRSHGALAAGPGLRGAHPAGQGPSASPEAPSPPAVIHGLPASSLLTLELRNWCADRVTWGWAGCLTLILVLGELLYVKGFLAPGEEVRWGGFVLLMGLPWAYGFGVARDRECGFLSYCLANLTSPGRYLGVRVFSAILRVTGLLLLVGVMGGGLAWVRGGDGWRVGAQMGSWACVLLFLLPALLWLEVVGRARFPAVALALIYAGAGLLLVALGKEVELLWTAMGVGGGLPDHPDLALVTRALGGGLVAWMSVPLLARGVQPGLK